MPGWDERSTLALRDMVRGFEQEFGYPAHMFGSNGNDLAKQRVDYILEHGYFPRKPKYNKPNVWQEYNGGEKPLTADLFMMHVLEARSVRGAYMALWRGWRPMSAETIREIVARWDTDDGSFMKHRALPADEAPGWGRPYLGSFSKKRAFEKAAGRMWNPRGKHPIMSLKMLAFLLQEDGEYAGWNGDHVLIHSGNAFEEIHFVSFGDGCKAGNVYKGTHPFSGTLPPANPVDPDPTPDPEPTPNPTSCDNPVMDMNHGQTRIKLDCDGYWCDATPSVHGGDFCAAIGLPCMPGYGTELPCVNGMRRLDCPPRPEGHDDRQICETAFYLGDPLWRTDGTLIPNPENRSQARTTDGTWIEVCRADGTMCTRHER